VSAHKRKTVPHLREAAALLRIVASKLKNPELGSLGADQLIAISEWYEEDLWLRNAIPVVKA
jgi:hypothetical protein